MWLEKTWDSTEKPKAPWKPACQSPQALSNYQGDRRRVTRLGPFMGTRLEMGRLRTEVVYVCGREPRSVGEKPYAWVVCMQLGIRGTKTVEEGHKMKECPEMAGLVP
jgi:hypothetical protein